MKKLNENEIIEKVFQEGLFNTLRNMKKNINIETLNNAVRDFIKKITNYPNSDKKEELLTYLDKFLKDKIKSEVTTLADIQAKATDLGGNDNKISDLNESIEKIENILNNTSNSTGKTVLQNIIKDYKEKGQKQFILYYTKTRNENRIADRFYEIKDMILKKIKEFSRLNDKKTEIKMLEIIYEIMNKEVK